MSLNFNKLFLQDILSRRESPHALDLNEENLKIQEESEYSAEDNDDDNDPDEYDDEDNESDDRFTEDNNNNNNDNDEYSYYTDEKTCTNNKINENNKTTNKIKSGEHLQQFRLISALNNLRLAVDKQAKLQSLLIKEYNPTPDDTTNQTSNLSDVITTTTTIDNKNDTKRNIEFEIEQKDETTSPTSKTIQSKVTYRSSKKPCQHNTTDIPISLTDKDMIAFRRNERLSKRKEKDLTITLTSERPESEVELIPDKHEPCRINLQTLVDQQEWRLHEHIEITRRSATQEYTNSSQSHPCISVTCRAARRPGYFYWNVFLIMFFITGLSFATFAVPPERPENRLQLSFTLFLTSVAFKFVINQSLPKISYLTYMDKYVLMSLAILCVVSVWHAVVTLIPNRKSTHGHITTNDDKGIIDTQNSQKLSQQFNQQTWIALALQSKNREQHKRRLMMRIERDVFVSFCILYVLAHLTFIFWLYFDASRRRREMVERDRLYKKCMQASKAL
ncbi:unnamed protein product [Schistosoma mattheei]|uniref:Neur_chan_memb domain-containing protein n=1 Tax=Schistosoma mattheei TaxID=31246 RepID=A0AA85BFM0_9TREM|nr:unnamed protein product [Schistosoma mattheei]